MTGSVPRPVPAVASNLTVLPGAGEVVVAAGAGVTGLPVIRFLAARGCRVIVTSDRPAPAVLGEITGDITFAGDLDAPPADATVVVMSAGIAPHRPLPAAAAAAGIPVVGEVELAWLVDQLDPRGARPWLVVTGTNGKTSTVEMLEGILRAAELSVRACGNIGWPLLTAVLADGPVGQELARQDVIAVELSSFQLFYGPSIRPRAGVVLNLAADHLEWHGDLDAYAAAKAIALAGEIAVGVIDDPGAAKLLAASPAARRIGVTAADPLDGQVGIRTVLGGQEVIDEAFGGGDLFPVHELYPAGPHQLTNAMAAATLARAVGVAGEPIRTALAAFRPGHHRAELVVATCGGRPVEIEDIRFVDDSKATNPHAAAASLLAFDRVVWVAGGQLKGAPVDELVIAVRDRLVGVVVLGIDAAVIIEALARHAPDVPRILVRRTDDGAMVEVVDAARGLATQGLVRQGAAVRDSAAPDTAAPDAAASSATPSAVDAAARGITVVFAPAAASLDMFSSYGARGDAFVDAVRALAGSSGDRGRGASAGGGR